MVLEIHVLTLGQAQQCGGLNQLGFVSWVLNHSNTVHRGHMEPLSWQL
jgi:hypothetical protein